MPWAADSLIPCSIHEYDAGSSVGARPKATSAAISNAITPNQPYRGDGPAPVPVVWRAEPRWELTVDIVHPSST